MLFIHKKIVIKLNTPQEIISVTIKAVAFRTLF